MEDFMSARICSAALVVAALFIAPAQAANISVQDWGQTAKGETVQLYTLKGAHGLEAQITNYGGVIAKLLVPTKDGRKVDVELGYDDFNGYRRGGVYGAVIGRYDG